VKRVLVTGATGFVGRAACARLLREGCEVRAAVRGEAAGLPAGVQAVRVGDIDRDTAWAAALAGVDHVLHLAARVHQLRDDAADPLAEYRATTVEGTRRLAGEAARAGVQRLVFASSVKVNGEATPPGECFRGEDVPQPEDPYGLTKWEAEQALHDVAAGGDLQIAVVRPPLVYGPGVRANFLALVRAVDRRLPLPLAGIRNARSLIYVENLVDALLTCLRHPRAAGRTYLVSDGDPVATPVLLREVGTALARPARLFPVPGPVLRVAGALTGRSSAVSRLTDSLVVDDAPIRRELDWSPPFTLAQGLTATTDWYRASVRGGTP
jgi:nucleoside-diphosphate-sugar epimerase